MGFFKKLFSKKSNSEEDFSLDNLNLEIGKAESANDIERQLSNNCDQVVDSTYNIEDLRLEYDLVTAYLLDIQRLEALPDINQKELYDIASKIQLLEKDRAEFLKTDTKMSDEQFKRMQAMEPDIKNIMEKLSECEIRDDRIHRDMQHLEGEKASIEYVAELIEDKRHGIKNVFITMVIMTGITLALFLILAIGYRMDMRIPSLIMILVLVIVLTAVFLYNRSLQVELKNCEARLNRAVMLINKVKIKYINNTNTLEYMYEKYKVHSLKELEYKWEQYVVMLDEVRRFKQNTGDLRVYCEELIKALVSFGIRDADVWTKQSIALMDSREMVEVKHELNVRRQKLREQIEYNEELKTMSLKRISEILEDNPEMKQYVKNALASYNIEV